LSEWIRKRSFDLKKIVFEPQVHPFHIDFMRHVSNIVYIEWMEVGRCALLEAVGLPVVAIAEQGFGPVLVDKRIDPNLRQRFEEYLIVEPSKSVE